MDLRVSVTTIRSPFLHEDTEVTKTFSTKEPFVFFVSWWPTSNYRAGCGLSAPEQTVLPVLWVGRGDQPVVTGVTPVAPGLPTQLPRN
jgi:hypothetical protein